MGGEVILPLLHDAHLPLEWLRPGIPTTRGKFPHTPKLPRLGNTRRMHTAKRQSRFSLNFGEVFFYFKILAHLKMDSDFWNPICRWNGSDRASQRHGGNSPIPLSCRVSGIRVVCTPLNGRAVFPSTLAKSFLI